MAGMLYFNLGVGLGYKWGNHWKVLVKPTRGRLFLLNMTAEGDQECGHTVAVVFLEV